jgi:hypothetical protein
MFQKIELRKTRDFSAKINVTFEFIRQNFKPLAKAMLYISGPISIVGGMFMGLYQENALTAAGRLSSPFAGIFSIWYLLAIVFVLLASVCSSVVAVSYVHLYETKSDPQNIEVSEVWEGVKENYFRVLGSTFLVVLAVILGCVLLIIPGIYMAVPLSLIIPVLIIEQRPFSDAFSRCFALITEKWWSTFGLVIVTSMIVGFMGYIFQLPQLVFTLIIAFNGAHESFTAPLWQQIGMMVSSVIATVGTNLLQCVTAIAIVFQFYNLVERREARGLLTKLESFGKAESNPTPNDETY